MVIMGGQAINVKCCICSDYQWAMAMLISLITLDICHSQTFCSYFTSSSNHENPFRLLLLVLHNNNEI